MQTSRRRERKAHSAPRILRQSRIDRRAAVTVGESTVIASDVTIMDTDHHTVVGSSRNTAPVVINSHVWIDTRAVILKGVTIGHRAVIAAGSVVNKHAEAGYLYAGVPARKVRPIQANLGVG